MAGAARSRVDGGLWPPDWKCSHGPGLGLFAARRRVDWRGADGGGGTPMGSVVAARRVPRARRTSALPRRSRIEPRYAIPDAARSRARLVVVSYERPGARDWRGVDTRSLDRRPS